MNQYNEMKARHQEEVNSFPMKFAFGQEQLAAALAEWGLTANDMDKVTSIYGCGDILLKKDVAAWEAMCKRHKQEMDDTIAADKTGDGFIFDMFDAELSNHEYGYTRDPYDALAALGLSYIDVYKDARLIHGFEKACKNQAEWYDKNR